MAPIRTLLLVFALLALAVPAQAADVIYPVGSRVGLAPPPGTSPSQSFAGFEDPTNGVAMAVVSLPVEAYRNFVGSPGTELEFAL